MMIESNIRKMGRLELLYTCLSNLVKELHRDGKVELLEGLEHYAEPDDRNRVIYHNKEASQDERLQAVIDDAVTLLSKCTNEYAQSADYQLLERAIREQTKKDDEGRTIPKGKGEGMDSSCLQNPSDPDATFRSKAGKSHRGYVENITETVGENGSIVTDYQYDVNTRSDVDFLHEAIENTESSDTVSFMIADGAYAGKEVEQEAAEKNILLVTTGLRGGEPREILTQFELSEDRHTVLKCPAGESPKTCSYKPHSNSILISFARDCCEYCPHQDECRAKLKARTAVVNLSLGALAHAEEVLRRKDNAAIQLFGRIRNGVETIPSVLRRKYRVDEMPVRGKLKTKVFVGFKMLALNFTKLLLHERGLQKSRPLQVETA